MSVLDSIREMIQKAKKILIITHENPDGDAVGSSLGFMHGLKKLEKEVDVYLPVVNKMYSFLPGFDCIKNELPEDAEYDLCVALDSSDLERLGEGRKWFEKIADTIVIDHHKTNSGYGKLNHIRGGISSTGEVLFDLFEKLDIEVTPEMATGLYAAILTDTGCFKYESTTEHTFEIASKIAKLVNTSEIADLCYTNKPKNLILFQNYLISNAIFCLNDKIAYTLITQEIIDKYSAKDEYTEGICETLRSIAGVEIAFVLKETTNGVKVSIRTKDIDATKITGKFNGGGHKRAAGCTIKEKINTAAQLLIQEAKALI